MKSSSFSIHLCDNFAQAAGLLSELKDVKVLAGGQSLIPLMNQRVTTPSNLLDVNNIAGLDQIDITDAGITIGATARQSAVEKSGVVQSELPVISAALAHVGHPQVRNRGTVVGSICQADSAAEMPAVFAALGGTVSAASASGIREIDADDFYTTAGAIAADEFVTAVTFRPLGAGAGWAFQEVTRRKYGVAIVGVVTVLTVTDGVISRARIAVHGAGTQKRRVTEFESALVGTDATKLESSQEAILDLLPSAALEFSSDFHASAGYRRAAACQLAAKGIRTALRRAAA